MNDLIYRLRKRAEIRRNNTTRKSVQEGKPDRISDLLEEAADAIESKISNINNWYESTAKLDAIYGEMCAINETPRKDQTQEQTDRLKILRQECIDLHYKRILMNVKWNKENNVLYST